MSTHPTLIRRHQAAAHEALYPRLAALTKQIEATALKRPEAMVPEGVRMLAEGMLFDARRFTWPRPRFLPVAALAYDGLAIQLGMALAQLDAFEARHAAWSPAQKGFFWLVNSPPMPVARRRQQLVPEKSNHTPEQMAALRAKVEKRMAEVLEQRFAARLAAEGAAPTPAED